MVTRCTQYLLALCLLVSVPACARGLPDLTGLIDDNFPAVVKINTVERNRTTGGLPPQYQEIPDIFRHLLEPRRQQRPVASMGSGFIVSSDGYVVTNNHVVDGADEVVVTLTDRREYEAKIIGTDTRSDLALLKIDADDLQTIRWGDSEKLKVGEWVVAIGSPFGLDYSASAGIVSAMGRSIPNENRENYVPFIQTDVAINPGNSGGPLFNLKGEVVGINSQIYTRSGGSIGLSFAIPSSVARDVVEQLKEKGRVDRGWLGVAIQDVDRNLAKAMGLGKPNGALVAQVEAGAPADQAGIKVGDIITRFDGRKIMVSGDLPHVVGQTRPGSEVAVDLMREGRQKTVRLTVGALPGDEGEHQAGTSVPSGVGGRLGLIVDEIPETLKQRWGVESGVLVKRVVPGKPGAKAGLRSGDIIAQLGFEEVEDLKDYNKVVEDLPADELLPIRFFRAGQPTFRTIQIDD
ncbi:DegQ family serine endoprotease [Microbulbifer thermotolerans]|uniref:Probable periplasmic serine endoprotease DegP-like n=1 Tax=Microbulbifer thermotolerans TaxID=252514 RepID=A0AB35HUM9_MICTH|nr:DegQ family serine endoprotease [Microbulbifer thermotolerans]MCX2778750.1 DegQ family serine endoprotease [Microbulbifer thermotolerans]MCX2784388.1 DegQ family serine endoprotease [Microbulbifer thermotolerans]MCX2793636.1 DegQ family serine endoprotease [Microbulbifer thermotolerans]MCX2800820.1 DegQ family serine endoprotease [Microbulbifer thermotolerans]MCX2804055.1 DegQ family serine endoprotease [Microbulbifer thermotolerans]